MTDQEREMLLEMPAVQELIREAIDADKAARADPVELMAADFADRARDQVWGADHLRYKGLFSDLKVLIRQAQGEALNAAARRAHEYIRGCGIRLELADRLVVVICERQT